MSRPLRRAAPNKPLSERDLAAAAQVRAEHSALEEREKLLNRAANRCAAREQKRKAESECLPSAVQTLACSVWPRNGVDIPGEQSLSIIPAGLQPSSTVAQKQTLKISGNGEAWWLQAQQKTRDSSADSEEESEIQVPTSPSASASANPPGSQRRGRGKGFHRPGQLSPADVNTPAEFEVPGLSRIRSTIDKLREAGELSLQEDIKPEWRWKHGTFVNCDLRYVNMASLGSRWNVTYIDPPWRLGAGMDDERSMFVNNPSFHLGYNTMSDAEILDMNIGSLSESGFIFLWTINYKLELALKCLKRWGYKYVDRITWVKTRRTGTLALGQGHYFLHSTELCLVGTKRAGLDAGAAAAHDLRLQYLTKVTNDVLFSPVRLSSQKPDEMYEIIERMLPGARKIELFARNHNIRKGWLSVGNQLGEYFDWASDKVWCDHCHQPIAVGQARYKFVDEITDLCEPCMRKHFDQVVQHSVNRVRVLRISNEVEDMVFHDWYACNFCERTPLWGIRFHCKDCSDLDLCEECFDQRAVLATEQPAQIPESHTDENHDWSAIEIPVRAGGFAVHRQSRCTACATTPIIGQLFMCCECNGVELCERCFFLKKEPKDHSCMHRMRMALNEEDAEAVVKSTKRARRAITCCCCNERADRNESYECDTCLRFVICTTCYLQKRPAPPSYIAHKHYHIMSKILKE